MTISKISAEDYYSILKAEDIQVSHEYVAWVEKKPDSVKKSYHSHIFVYDKKKMKFKQFTTGKGDHFPRFSPNGKQLAFISRRADKAQIFVVDMDGGEAIKFTNMKQGVNSFSWSPDGTKLLIQSKTDLHPEDENDEDTLLKKKISSIIKEDEISSQSDPRVITNFIYRSGTSYLSETDFSHLYQLDISSKKVNRITDGEFNYSEGRWLDNDTIITVAKREFPIDNSLVAQLIKFDINHISMGDIILSFNSAYFSEPPEVGEDKIMVSFDFERSKGGQNTHWGIVDAYKSEINAINKILDRSIYQIKIQKNGILCLVEDIGKGDIRKFIDDKFIKLFATDICVLNYDGDDKDIYFIGTDPKHPSAVWRWDGVNISLIRDLNADLLANREIILPEEFWLKNPEGIKFQGWFFDAGMKDGVKPPLILSIHGGPHVMWNNAGSMWHEWQFSLAKGYSILAVNPIGSGGYGEKFSQIITAKWGIDDARDLLMCVDHFIDRVDEDQLYLTGGSYAGFQVANIIGRDNRFKAACAQRGVYNLSTFWSTTDIPLWGLWEVNTTPWENLELMWELSPISRAKKIDTPLLIIHSENDFRVSISQAEELFASLKLDNKEVVFVRYPRDGHELSRSGEPDHVVDRLTRMIDFFDSH